MRRILLLLSLTLNIILIAILIWFHGYTRKKIFNMVSDFTDAQTERAKHVLKELESGSAERVEAAKERLRDSIEKSKDTMTNWESGSKVDKETQDNFEDVGTR